MAEKFTVAISIKAIDQFSQKFDQINQKINKVAAPFKDLNKSLGNLSKVSGLTGFATQLGKVGSAGKNFLGELIGGFSKLGVVVGVASAAFGTFIKSAVDDMSNIEDASLRLGISAEKFQELRYAASQTGIDLERVEPLFTRLSDTIGDAALGTGKAADIFNALGVSARNADGSMRGIDQVLPELADKFKGIKNETLKNQIAMQLFGKEGVKFAGLLSQGSEGLAKFAQEARDMGAVLDGESIKKGEAFGDVLAGMMQTLTKLRNEIAVQLLPVLEDLAKEFQAFIAENKDEIIAFAKEFAKNLPATIAGLAKIFSGLMSAIQPLIPIFSFMIEYMGLANVIAGTLAVTIFGKTALAFASFGKELFNLGVKVLPLIMGGLQALWALILANPITAVIAGVALLGVALYKNFEPFKNLIDGIWEKIKSLVSIAGSFLGFGGGDEAATTAGAQGTNINAREIVNRQIQSTTQKQVTENRLAVDFSNVPRGTKIQSEPADFMDMKAGFSGASF